MTYWCDNCQQGFTEDEVAGGEMVYSGNEVDPPEYSDIICPFCGSELTEGSECARCGRPIDPDEVFCDDCKEELAAQIERNLDEIQRRYFDEVDTYYKENKWVKR